MLVRLTARLLGFTLSEIDINPKVEDPKNPQPNPANYIKKSLTGKFPVLETAEGHTIMEGLSIAKFLGRQKHSFYGNNDLESNS